MSAPIDWPAILARRPGAAPAVDFRVGMTCTTATPGRRLVIDGAGEHVGWSDGSPAMVEEITRHTEAA